MTISWQYIDKESYLLISKSDYNDFLKKIKEKPSIILSSPNLQLPKEGLDKYDNKHRELNKRRNNPIELTD